MSAPNLDRTFFFCSSKLHLSREQHAQYMMLKAAKLRIHQVHSQRTKHAGTEYKDTCFVGFSAIRVLYTVWETCPSLPHFSVHCPPGKDVSFQNRIDKHVSFQNRISSKSVGGVSCQKTHFIEVGQNIYTDERILDISRERKRYLNSNESPVVAKQFRVYLRISYGISRSSSKTTN